MVGDTVSLMWGVGRSACLAFKNDVFSQKHVWLRCLWEPQVEGRLGKAARI